MSNEHEAIYVVPNMSYVQNIVPYMSYVPYIMCYRCDCVDSAPAPVSTSVCHAVGENNL